MSYSISHLLHLPENSSGKSYVTLPVYVLALRKLKLGIMLVTDFTPNKNSVFYEKGLNRLPSHFSVGGKPLQKSQVFSISIAGSRVGSIWEKMNMQFRLNHFDVCDDQKCDVSQLGIIAIVNFRVQKYQGCLEGFLSSLITCGRRSDTMESIAAQMQNSDFSAFMGRLACHMNETLYDEMARCFPIERYMDRVAIGQPKSEENVGGRESPENVIPKRHVARSERHVIPKRHVTSELWTQTVENKRLPPNEVIYQQQDSQKTPVTQKYQNIKESDTSVEQTRTSETRTSENTSVNTSVNTPSEAALVEDGTSQRQVLQTQMAGFQTQSSQEIVQNQAGQGGPVPKRRYNVHDLHQMSAGQFQRLHIEHIAPTTTFEVAAIISHILPDPSDIFVKPYGKTIRVSPFVMRLGDIPIELHSADEACTFFGVDEIEMLIHHIQEYSQNLQSLIGQNVKIRVERRINVFGQGYERPYWGISSTMENLLGSAKAQRGEKRVFGMV